MHSTEPEKARPEGVEAEVFSTFKMAGSRGNLRTVLTSEDVVLESDDGKYLRLSYSKVEGMRHHQFHIIPHWCGLIAMLMIYSSVRILTGQLQIWAGVIGAGVIISWLGFRKSALTIDSGEAGTYTLFGNDTDLIKFRVIADRVRDGIPFEKAIEGVNEVIMSEYPSSSIFDELVETIETEISENTDALSMAMADLIEKSKNEEEVIQSEMIESDLIVVEEQIPNSREPLHHGSITRARQVQSDIRPAHSGWANVANRTEVLRPEPNDSFFQNETPQPISNQSTEEPFNLFGFDLDESSPKEEPFNMFGDSFETTANSDIFTEPSEPRSSFSMMPDSVSVQSNQNYQESVESNLPFINSFQQTGHTNPLNHLGATLSMHSEESKTTTTQPQLPGIVSQAKGDIEEVIDAEIIQKVKVDGLKRIKLKNGTKNLKRLKPNDSPARRLTVWSMITSSLNIKTPEFIRNRVSNASKKLIEESGEILPNRTMDALKIQAHHTHEAQLADALKMIPKNDEASANHFLEEISPDLVEQKLPSSFHELKASNDEQNDILSTTGIARLD